MSKNNYTSIKSEWFKCAYSNTNNTNTNNNGNSNISSSCPDLYTLSYKHLKTINTINSLGQLEKSIVKVQIDPAWQTFSNIINNSIYHTAGQKLTYANNTLNALGYWAGSPSGYGKPIRNTFN
jgi:hypothetical protein